MEFLRGDRVVKYVRCSTDQQVNSIADQDKVVQQTVDLYGLEVVKTYSDEGISGATIDERPELNAMIREIASLSVVAILVYNLSRLTRGGVFDMFELCKMFIMQGVNIYLCQERRFIDTNNLASILQTCIDAGQAKEYNRQHSQDITRAMIANVVDRNNAPGSKPPYGYDRMYIDESGASYQRVRWNPDGSKDIIDPTTGETIMHLSASTRYPRTKTHRVTLVESAEERVATIQDTFRLAASVGYKKIVEFLNEKGTPAPNGGLWNISSLRDIIANPVYKGDLVFNRTHKGRYCGIKDGKVDAQEDLSGKIIFRDNPEDEWIVIPNAYPAIVTPEEWEEAQNAVESRRKRTVGTPRGQNRSYPLSGFLRCGNCGGPMQGICQERRRYICSTRRKHGKSQCVPCSVDAAKMEDFVLSQIWGELTSECARDALRQGLEQMYDSMHKISINIEALERDLARLKKKKDLLTKELDPDQIDSFKEQAAAITAEEKSLKKRLAVAQASMGANQSKEDFVAASLAQFEQQLMALNSGGSDAIRGCLANLGTTIMYNPHGKDGTITLYPFGHAIAGVEKN